MNIFAKNKLIGINVALVGGIFFIDQVTKHVIQQSEMRKLILGPLRVALDTSYNPNLAFSIKAPEIVSTLLILGVFIVVSYLWIRQLAQRDWSSLFGASIIGGALGNIYDRLTIGAVVDFFEFSIQSFSWSSFNIADVAIVVGILGWIYIETRSSSSKVT